MSTVPLTKATPKPNRFAFPGLRGTGAVGHISAVIIGIALFIAVFGASLALYDPNETNLSLSFVGPTGDHYLGFDSQGRDILSRILTGARFTLAGPAVVVVLSILVGTAL